MARRNVITTAMFKYRRSAPKTPFLGWGHIAVRKETTEASSPKLLAYRSCMAGGMSGASGTLADVQSKFKSVAGACKAKVAGIATRRKK